MNGKRNWLIDIALIDVATLSLITIGLILYALIPYQYDTVKAQTGQTTGTVQNIVHFLTHDELSQLYTCKPEERHKDINIQEFTYTEAQLLMKVARAEGGDTLDGQLWVMRTIVNRLYDETFPNTITDVLMQDGQFDVVTTGKYLEVEPNVNSHIALALIEGGWNNAKQATYWEATSNTDHSWHKRNLVYVQEVEGNIFYHE